MFKLDEAADFRVVSCAPKMGRKDDGTQVRKTARDSNEPLWTVTALYYEEADSHPELVKVTVPSFQDPEFVPMRTGLENVKMAVWEVGGKSGVYFTADALVELEEAA